MTSESLHDTLCSTIDQAKAALFATGSLIHAAKLIAAQQQLVLRQYFAHAGCFP